MVTDADNCDSFDLDALAAAYRKHLAAELQIEESLIEVVARCVPQEEQRRRLATGTMIEYITTVIAALAESVITALVEGVETEEFQVIFEEAGSDGAKVVRVTASTITTSVEMVAPPCVRRRATRAPSAGVMLPQPPRVAPTGCERTLSVLAVCFGPAVPPVPPVSQLPRLVLYGVCTDFVLSWNPFQERNSCQRVLFRAPGGGRAGGDAKLGGGGRGGAAINSK